MKNIAKRVNTEVVDYAADFMTSNLSIGGHGHLQSETAFALHDQKMQILLISKQAEVD